MKDFDADGHRGRDGRGDEGGLPSVPREAAKAVPRSQPVDGHDGIQRKGLTDWESRLLLSTRVAANLFGWSTVAIVAVGHTTLFYGEPMSSVNGTIKRMLPLQIPLPLVWMLVVADACFFLYAAGLAAFVIVCAFSVRPHNRDVGLVLALLLGTAVCLNPNAPVLRLQQLAGLPVADAPWTTNAGLGNAIGRLMAFSATPLPYVWATVKALGAPLGPPLDLRSVAAKVTVWAVLCATQATTVEVYQVCFSRLKLTSAAVALRSYATDSVVWSAAGVAVTVATTMQVATIVAIARRVLRKTDAVAEKGEEVRPPTDRLAGVD